MTVQNSRESASDFEHMLHVLTEAARVLAHRRRFQHPFRDHGECRKNQLVEWRAGLDGARLFCCCPNTTAPANFSRCQRGVVYPAGSFRAVFRRETNDSWMSVISGRLLGISGARVGDTDSLDLVCDPEDVPVPQQHVIPDRSARSADGRLRALDREPAAHRR